MQSRLMAKSKALSTQQKTALSIALVATSVVWIWSVHKSTSGMQGFGYENVFLTRTYEWLFYAVVSLVCFGIFILVAKNAPNRLAVAVGLFVCTATLALQVMSPIGLSTDYYRYIWQGRVSNAGQDNYALTPWDAGVEKANDELFERMDWRDVRSVYPPLAEQYFRISAAIFDAKILEQTSFQTRLGVSKIPSLALFLLCAFLLYKLTNRKLIAFAWLALPFLQYELVNASHVDVLSITLLLGALYTLKSRSLPLHVLAGSLVAAAGLVKITPFIVIVPIAAYLYTNYSLTRSLAAVAGFVAVIVAGVAPYILNDFALAKRTAFWFSGNEFSIGNPMHEIATSISSDYGSIALKIVMMIAGIAVLASIAKPVISKKLSYDTMLKYCLLLLLIPFIGAPIVLPWYWVTPFVVFAILMGKSNKELSKTLLIVFLLFFALLLTQYIDRAMDASLEVRRVVPVISGLALYALVIVFLYRYLYSSGFHSPNKLTAVGKK